MSEIDGPKISVNQVNFSSSQKQASEAEQSDLQESSQRLTDFSNNQAEAIGRSMLFKGNDDTNRDLKAIIEDPQIADNSDKLFELTYAQAQKVGLKHPYEEAASASTTSF